MVAKKNNLNLNEKNVEELNDLLSQARKEWMDLKMQLSIGKLKDVNEPKKKRKLIAQLQTVIREKQLKEMEK